MGSFGYIVIPVIVVISTLGAANASILTGSRVTFVSSQNGHAPSFLCKIHDATRTPVNALLFQAVLTTAFIMYGDFNTLINIYSMIAWVFYFLSVFGLFVLRITEPFANRPFKVWIVIPFIFCLVSAALLIFSASEAPGEAVLAIIFLASGIPVYLIGIKYQITAEGNIELTRSNRKNRLLFRLSPV